MHGRSTLQHRTAACARSGAMPSKPCTHDDPADVMDDIGLDNESFSVVIVGGGPHALAALAALSHADAVGTGLRPTARTRPANSSHGVGVHRQPV